MNKGWREHVVSGGIFTILRIWLGVKWLTSGWGKITADEPFNPSGYFMGALAEANVTGDNPVVLPFWAWFLENIAVPNAELFGFLVSWGEVLVGLGLIIGCLTIPAIWGGMLMNMAFLLSGTTKTNPIMFTVGIILLWSSVAAWKYGADRWIIPFLKSKFGKKNVPIVLKNAS